MSFLINPFLPWNMKEAMTLMSLQNIMMFFLLWNMKQNIYIEIIMVSGHQNSFVTVSAQNIFLCVPQRRESHTYLEQYEGE